MPKYSDVMGVLLKTRPGKHGPIYYLEINHSGIRKRETLKIDHNLPAGKRKDIAESIATDRRAKLMRHEYGDVIKPRSINFFRYFDQVIKQDYPGNRKYINTLRHMRLCFGSSLLTNHMSNESMSKWRKYLIDNFNGETPATMWRATRAVINRGVKAGVFARDPAPDIKKPPIPDGRSKEVLYPNELKALFNQAWPDDLVCRAFLTCCYTGLGYPEISALHWGQISLMDDKLTYRRSKTKSHVIVDLSPTVLDLIGQPESDDPKALVFPFLPSDVTAGKVLKKWCKAAGIHKRITWYCARHTFAVLLLSHGADLKTVASLMGHSSVAITEGYLNYVDRLKSDAVQRLPRL